MLIAAYQARPKATPTGTTEPHYRIRRDTVDTTGVVTLRHAGRLHHIGIGRTTPEPASSCSCSSTTYTSASPTPPPAPSSANWSSTPPLEVGKLGLDRVAAGFKVVVGLPVGQGVFEEDLAGGAENALLEEAGDR
jgi:hypothetical protein